MRIPSGDLAPARRSRRGYGRRSPLRKAVPVLVAVAAIAAIGGGAYALRRDDEGAPQRLAETTSSACPTPTPSALPPTKAPVAAPMVLPAPGKVAFRLLNGTPRDGLGRTLGNTLAARGFRVLSTGNAPKPLVGASRVYYGPGAKAAAQLVAIHVIGAELSPVPHAPKGNVDLVIGTTFARLRNPAEVVTFTQRVLAGTAPTKAPVATAAPTPVCR